jgi:hypothetical protein
MVSTSAGPSAATAALRLPLRLRLGASDALSAALILLTALPTLLLLLLAVLLLSALTWLLESSAGCCCSSSLVLKLLAPMLLVLRMADPSLLPMGVEPARGAAAAAAADPSN